MEKYIDALKLGAKRKQEEPVTLIKRKMKQPKKPKITAEEYLEKTKKKPFKQTIQKPKTISSVEKKKLKLLEEQYKELKKKLKKEQEAKFSKSETQIKLEQQEETEKQQKEAEKLQKLALELQTVSKLSAQSAKQPLTILNNDLEFKKLTKKEQDDVKAQLKQFPRDKQLEFVNKYVSLSLKDRKAFLTKVSPTAVAKKGTIKVISAPSSAPATTALPPLPASAPATPAPASATPQPVQTNVQNFIDAVNYYKGLYFGTNRDKLDELWEEELKIIIPQLQANPAREIEVTKIAEVNNELIARVDAPLPTAFIAPGVFAKGQASLDADDEEAEELLALSKNPSVIPASAQQNIDRTNAVAVNAGNQPTIIRQVTPAGTPISASAVPSSAVVVPVVAKQFDFSGMKKKEIKEQITTEYTEKQYEDAIKVLFPGEKLSKISKDQLKQLLIKLKEDEALQASVAPKAQATQITQLIDTSLIPVSAQLAQIPDAPEVVITPTDVDATIADASAPAPAPLEDEQRARIDATASATASGFANGLKKVKKMRGKKVHDKVVHIMAINNALHSGLNKVKKMHGGAMHDKVKSILMRGGDVKENKTPADNVYIMISDLSEFVDSDFYKQNSNIITKYPPVKKIFNAVPVYKPYRIVVRSMGDSYHTIFTIDANENNFNTIIKSLVDLGGVNQLDYGKSKSKQADIQSTKQVQQSVRTFNRGIQRGYEEGYAKQAEEEDNSPLSSIVKGFMIPVSIAKELL